MTLKCLQILRKLKKIKNESHQKYACLNILHAKL